MTEPKPSRLDRALKLFAIAPWALILSCPVVAVLGVIVQGGIEVPLRQIRLPEPVETVYIYLTLLLPWVTGIMVAWWGFKPKRILAAVPFRVILVGWIAFVGVCTVDKRWGCTAAAPPGEIWLCNATAGTVKYSTDPGVSDDSDRELFGGKRMRSGSARRLYGLPTDKPLHVEAADDKGGLVFCGEYAPEDLSGRNRRIDIVAGEIDCR